MWTRVKSQVSSPNAWPSVFLAGDLSEDVMSHRTSGSDGPSHSHPPNHRITAWCCAQRWPRSVTSSYKHLLQAGLQVLSNTLSQRILTSFSHTVLLSSFSDCEPEARQDYVTEALKGSWFEMQSFLFQSHGSSKALSGHLTSLSLFCNENIQTRASVTCQDDTAPWWHSLLSVSL